MGTKLPDWRVGLGSSRLVPEQKYIEGSDTLMGFIPHNVLGFDLAVGPPVLVSEEGRQNTV